MQFVSVAQPRGQVRALLVPVLMTALLFVGMPGLWAAFSTPTVVIAVVGGLAVGVSALAARSRRAQRRF